MADTSHNRESSAFPYLLKATQLISSNTSVPGVYEIESKRLENCLTFLNSKKSRHALAEAQKLLLKRLEGQSHLFAKDYLNFLLGESFKLNDL